MIHPYPPHSSPDVSTHTAFHFPSCLNWTLTLGVPPPHKTGCKLDHLIPWFPSLEAAKELWEEKKKNPFLISVVDFIFTYKLTLLTQLHGFEKKGKVRQNTKVVKSLVSWPLSSRSKRLSQNLSVKCIVLIPTLQYYAINFLDSLVLYNISE